MKKKPKILIVGSGIVGASIALACQNLGADVVVVEKGKLGGLASSNSFGWINASFAPSQEYFKLRDAAVDTFRQFSSQLDLNNSVRWQGTLWWEDTGLSLKNHFSKLKARGYQAKWLNKNEIEDIEPNLKNAPKEAILTPLEGAGQADKVALAILATFTSLDGRVLSGCEVTALDFYRGHVSRAQTSVGDIECDLVVMATGAAAQHGLMGIDWVLPMQNKKGMILQTSAVPHLINHIMMTDDVHFRQNADGSLTAGEIFSGDLDPSLVPLDLASDVMARLRLKLHGLTKINLTDVKIGTRPVPMDGFPVVGNVPGHEGLFVAVMHSGVTLAPLIGRLLASEMLQKSESSLLAPFRPSRF
jgi:glycine/D-amino acid oxidase-like deaminating enzyme